MQHATARPVDPGQRRPCAQVVQECRAREARGAAVVTRDHRPEHRHRVARRRLCRRSSAFQHGDRHAALRQRMRGCSARHPGADDGDVPGRCGFNPAGCAREARAQAVPLAAVAGALVAHEASLRQALAHQRRHRVGGGHGAGLRQPRQRLEQPGLPQVGVAVRREAVEIKGVDPGLQLRQAVRRIAQQQGELHPSAVERNPVEARHQHRPVRPQRARKRGVLRPLRMQARQIISLEGMFLDRQEMQPVRPPGIGPPGRPGHQEIQAGAKTGFQDRENRASPPSLRQAATLQEHMERLPRAAVGGMVDVAVGGGIRHALLEFETGWNDGFRHGRMLHCPGSSPFAQSCRNPTPCFELSYSY